MDVSASSSTGLPRRINGSDANEGFMVLSNDFSLRSGRSRDSTLDSFSIGCLRVRPAAGEVVLDLSLSSRGDERQLKPRRERPARRVEVMFIRRRRQPELTGF
ncbi:hypothetical protein SUGI_0347560 [Cryptomeria japonica]|nr:hypothetical protein SUGI_0347560 [Cryptomeria japonica]